MKKHLTLLLMALTILTDTLAGGRHDDEHPGGWNFDLTILKTKKADNTAIGETELSVGGGFAFGFIAGTGQAKGLDINMGQSYELEWSEAINVETRIGKHDLLRVGLGFDWRNYRVTDFMMFSKDERGIISMQPYPDGMEPKFSRIHTFSLSIPVKYQHFLSKHVYFAVGPELYFTPRGSLKTRYYESGISQKITSGNVHQSTVSLGLGAEVIIHHVGIYYKYNPFPVLRTSYGPRFSSMTTGIKVAF